MSTRYQIRVDTAGACHVVDTWPQHPEKDSLQLVLQQDVSLEQAIRACEEMNGNPQIELLGNAKGLLEAVMGKWTEQSPTEPDLYWWRYKGSNMAVILTVYRLKDDGRLYVEQKDRDVPLAEWTGGLWAGPIEHPPIED
jgi:hypothetical protein